ncbi:hypothetical protein BDK51DRAFT_43926 [Blyttiomyces helicus]|uniref:Uncharacterized protein n=1 Tax=Blyttiomyces helicus TaxID=388810 RepID=A0A4P9WCC1_9FUNG|nr:hypothetical protein BDK51DRAFT_43926 [Blyttiomyces helicus]|eukprot:RKO89962.1 hypothetical protein BDK51DRAFT_43926 [Blyttiomyces helicus]
MHLQMASSPRDVEDDLAAHLHIEATSPSSSSFRPGEKSSGASVLSEGSCLFSHTFPIPLPNVPVAGYDFQRNPAHRADGSLSGIASHSIHYLNPQPAIQNDVRPVPFGSSTPQNAPARPACARLVPSSFPERRRRFTFEAASSAPHAKVATRRQARLTSRRPSWLASDGGLHRLPARRRLLGENRGCGLEGETLAFCRSIFRAGREVREDASPQESAHDVDAAMLCEVGEDASPQESTHDVDAAVLDCAQLRPPSPPCETCIPTREPWTWATIPIDVLRLLFRWVRALGGVDGRAALYSCRFAVFGLKRSTSSPETPMHVDQFNRREPPRALRSSTTSSRPAPTLSSSVSMGKSST